MTHRARIFLLHRDGRGTRVFPPQSKPNGTCVGTAISLPRNVFKHGRGVRLEILSPVLQ